MSGDFLDNALRAFSDDAGASMDSGKSVVLLGRRRRGLFGLFDDPPASIQGYPTAAHIRARRRWSAGAVATQVSWSHHGRVRILRLADGTELAAWLEETMLAKHAEPRAPQLVG